MSLTQERARLGGRASEKATSEVGRVARCGGSGLVGWWEIEEWVREIACVSVLSQCGCVTGCGPGQVLFGQFLLVEF